MPELPEVETIKNFLATKIVGRKIKKIEINSPKQFIGNPKDIEGLKIKSLERTAKMILLKLEKNLSLLIHLKLTGQLVFAEIIKNNQAVFKHTIPFTGGNTLPGKTTRIILWLNKGAVFFNDLRKFGWIKVIKNEEFRIKNLKEIGIEPLSTDFTVEVLQKILAKTGRAIKVVLMDQTKIAGIGNIYANEILWTAKINPQTPAKEIKNVKELHCATIEVLKRGLKYQGSSASDEAYIKPDGTPGSFQKYLEVYQQTGKSCPRCKTKIVRINLAGRGTFLCPKCQK